MFYTFKKIFWDSLSFREKLYDSRVYSHIPQTQYFPLLTSALVQHNIWNMGVPERAEHLF